MKREFPETPLVGVGAIIIENGKVVLIRRARPPMQAEWSIPGGALEIGEPVRAGAEREAREETGLLVEAEDLLGVYDRVLSEDGRVRYHYVLVDFLCHRVGGEPGAADDAMEVRFFTPEELPGLGLPWDTLEVIGKGFEVLALRARADEA